MSDNSELLEAVRDLTRVMLALHGKFATTTEAVNKLLSLSIPQNRVADLLGLPGNYVRAVAAKTRKRTGSGKKNGKKTSGNARRPVGAAKD